MRNFASHTDDELLVFLAMNDEKAFTEIYDRFWKKLFAIAYNRLKETQAAEDIVHDVFASLWANRTSAKIQALENYLATVTKYMVLSKLKKKERERLYNSSVKEAPVIELPVETSLHYKRVLEIVNREVEKLPEKCRLIFKFSRNDGMPVKQIAHHLNISPKTVENQLNKALKQLRMASKTFLHCFL